MCVCLCVCVREIIRLCASEYACARNKEKSLCVRVCVCLCVCMCVCAFVYIIQLLKNHCLTNQELAIERLAAP